MEAFAVTDQVSQVLCHVEGVLHGCRQVRLASAFPRQPQLQCVIFPPTHERLVADIVLNVVKLVRLEQVGGFIAVTFQQQALKLFKEMFFDTFFTYYCFI